MTLSKIVCSVLFINSISAGSSIAFAGGSSGCHFHGSKPVEEKVVLDCSAKKVKNLISSGKIDAVWQGKSHDNIALVEIKQGKEWKVTYVDAAAKDPAKAKLFLFFALSGNFLAANHTGN